MNTSTRNLVICALCAAVICVLSPLSLPIGPVPISLATFAVMLSAALLGAKWGTIATAIYILLGAIGPFSQAFSRISWCAAPPARQSTPF